MLAHGFEQFICDPVTLSNESIAKALADPMHSTTSVMLFIANATST